MADNPIPGALPVSLNEARSWLRLGATVDDAVIAGLIRAATNICEAFIGRWLIVRAGEELVRSGGAGRLSARPVVAIDAVTLLRADGSTRDLEPGDWRATIAGDGSARVAIDGWDGADRARIAYRAGMAAGANAVPEAVRQGIMRMMQHLYEARDGVGTGPPAAIAALWQPWRRLTLGGGR